MHDIQYMRSSVGLTSSLATYFVNDSLNSNAGLSGCMESIAEKVLNLTSSLKYDIHFDKR